LGKGERKMGQRAILNYRFIFVALVVAILAPGVIAEVLFVNSINGDDTNPGTKEKPLKTIGKAAKLVNSSKKPGPTTIKVAPGVYALAETVVFENSRPYTKEKRLTIEATILPDEPQWKPVLMPIILPTAKPSGDKNDKGTYGLKIEMNHVTIRGLKFLGHPIPDSKHWPIRRDGKNLKDLIVAQCLFMGDRYILPIQVAVIARGNGIVVDHCIFYNCKNAVVLWDAEGSESRGCVMRYCIVDGAYTSGVWVTQTAEDFEFHHNIITRSKYAWMRDSSNRKKYRLQDCIITDNKHYSGKCDDDWKLSKERERPRNYLHVVPGTVGSDLGAGLFKKTKKGN